MERSASSLSSPVALAKKFGYHKHPKFKSSSELRNSSEKAAFSLLRKEESNAKRSRLELLLTQQYIGRYGTKNPSSRINQFIKSTITDFLNTYDNINVAESMLDTLEAQIKEVTTSLKRDSIATRAQYLKSANDNSNDHNMREDNHDNKHKNTRSLTELDNPNNWSVLNAIMALNDEEKIKAEQKLLLDKKQKFAKALEEQRNEIKRRQGDASEEKQKQLAKIQSDTGSFENDKLAAKVQKVQSHAKEKALIEAQIDARKQLRERERQAKIESEQRDVARAKRMAVEEEELRLKKKEEEKLRQEKVKEENERNKLIKEEMKRKDWEYAAKLNRDYEAKLAREEAARAKAFQDRIDALKAIEAAYENQAGKAIAAEAKATELRTNANMEQKQREDAEREQRKVDARNKELAKSKEFNAMLIETKMQKQAALRQADIDMRLKFEKDSLALKEKEKEKAEKKRLQMNELKSKLDEQVQIRRQGIRDKSALSDTEIGLNRAIMEKIAMNPDLCARVIDKVKPAATLNSVGFKWG